MQKCKAKKASKKSLKKKLKIGPAEPLTFNKANRRKEKVVIITKANREVIIRKIQLKRKIKYLYYFKTLAKLIKALNFNNSKKELEDGIFSILY